MKKLKAIFFEEGQFTEEEYPVIIKPSFSTLGSTIENFRQEPLISVIPNDSIRCLLGFHRDTLV